MGLPEWFLLSLPKVVTFSQIFKTTFQCTLCLQFTLSFDTLFLVLFFFVCPLQFTTRRGYVSFIVKMISLFYFSVCRGIHLILFFPSTTITLLLFLILLLFFSHFHILCIILRIRTPSVLLSYCRCAFICCSTDTFSYVSRDKWNWCCFFFFDIDLHVNRVYERLKNPGTQRGWGFFFPFSCGNSTAFRRIAYLN